MKPNPARYRLKVLHEIPGRIRVRHSVLHDPRVDIAYLEALLLNIRGVTAVRVNPGATAVIIRHEDGEKTRGNIFTLLKNLPAELFENLSGQEAPVDRMDLAARGAMTLLTPFLPRTVAAPLSCILSLPTLLQGVGTLFTEGLKVEVLDAVAVSLSLKRGDFFTANAVVTMLGLGQYMEQVCEQKSTDLLKTLLAPEVEQVRVERGGMETRIPAESLRVGEIVICGAGDLVPVDGTVESGEALVNQSSITGESVPVHLTPGDPLASGGVVEEGRLRIAATRVGDETNMSRIGRFLEKSIRSRSPSQKRSDEMADRLVPVTFGLGLGIFAATRQIKRTASVFTVDYSCAIKLATPVAVRMAIYTAARSGVLIKGSEALDAMARVKTLIFDKTGTLTKGKLHVTDVLPLGDLTENTLLSLAAGAEAHYAHPAADAVVEEAKERGIGLPPTSEVDFIVAHGVSAHIDGKRVRVGSRHFIADDEGIDCTASDAPARKLQENGNTLLYVAREERLEGIIALRDELRPDAEKTLAEFKAAGVEKIVILTGDHRRTARVLAERLPLVDEVHWELKPRDKARIVERLKAEAWEKGGFTAFVGDGVNDAPALVTADVGICMAQGSDLARESAKIVLLKDRLSLLSDALKISLQAVETIRNCFFTAVGSNSAILLLAATGKIQPFTSALLHNTGTIATLAYAAAAGSREVTALRELPFREKVQKEGLREQAECTVSP